MPRTWRSAYVSVPFLSGQVFYLCRRGHGPSNEQHHVSVPFLSGALSTCARPLFHQRHQTFSNGFSPLSYRGVVYLASAAISQAILAYQKFQSPSYRGVVYLTCGFDSSGRPMTP